MVNKILCLALWSQCGPCQTFHSQSPNLRTLYLSLANCSMLPYLEVAKCVFRYIKKNRNRPCASFVDFNFWYAGESAAIPPDTLWGYVDALSILNFWLGRLPWLSSLNFWVRVHAEWSSDDLQVRQMSAHNRPIHSRRGIHIWLYGCSRCDFCDLSGKVPQSA